MAKILLNEKLKEEIKKWRQKEYDGVSTITKRLLNFWFNEEHFIKDERFEFWRCQREAIEALIYLYEVCKYHSLYEIFKNLKIKGIQFDPTQDIWTKYCFKMATGSGKTFVMAMAIAWQYFNKIYGTKNGLRYSNHFLLIAPNLIVLDRLYGDETSACFKDNQIFKDFPFIPEEWFSDFDFQVIFQSQITPQHSKGVLYLTNIQQMYNKKRNETKNPIKNILGSEPPTEEEIIYNTLLADLAKYNDLLILNDEAHHVHSDYIEWYKVIDNLDTSIKNSYGNGIVIQLDFSATPYINPNVKIPFPHVIYDYPLGEAIKDKIVKVPKIGEIENAPEPISKKFVKKNRLQIDTGIEIFKKFKKDLKNIGKKPVLFIMCDNTTHASEVGEYLEQDKGYKNKVLVIHTDREGEVTIKDLDLARSVAKNIDKNQYEIIVSVMMLKEGWDVKNVVAIVPLRAYDSQILVEQTLGRGLRRMTPIEEGWDEKLIVIEHPRFSALWQTEIKEGELNIQITKAKKVYEPTNLISVIPPKVKKFDIEIPVVEGGLTKALPDLNKLDLSKFPHKVFKWFDIKIDDPRLIIKDLMTQKIEHKRELKFDYTEITEEYLSFMTKAILVKSGSSMQFPELVPIVKKYIENFLFDKKVDISNKENVKKLNWFPIREKIRDIFVDALNKLAKKEEKYKITKYYKVSETKPFHTSEPIYETKKTVFNALPYSKKSSYEKSFMIYLDKQNEVLSYTKVLPRFPLKIPYYENNNLRHYIPDFIVKTKENIYLIETKGAGFEEMLTAKLKEEFAKRWVDEISSLIKKKWIHMKVVDSDFNKYYNLPFSRLIKAVSNN